MPRGFTIAACALVLAAGVAAGAQSRSRSGVACGPLGATTLAASSQARVYVSSGNAYGCARSSHAIVRLGGRGSCIGTPRVDPVTVTAALAAYGRETCGIDTGATVVVVRRLTDGRQLRSAAATGPVGPESYQSVTSLVLKRDGAVGWIAEGRSLGTRHRVVEVRRSDRHGTTRLDSGASIRMRSLRLSGSTLRWRDGAHLRTAALS